MTEDEKFMKAALVQAKKAAAIDEVPIGCVIVYEGGEEYIVPCRDECHPESQ